MNGYVYGNKTGYENLWFLPGIRSCKHPCEKGLYDRTAGIYEKRKSKCGTLSLGQKQRLGLGIAMLGEPKILILDEPINGLDPSGIIEFRNLLRRLNEEKKITILLSSHILSELQQIADVYGFLSRGVLLEEISREELREKCADCIELSLSDTAGY